MHVTENLILFKDEDLVVVQKPCGIFVHPSRLDAYEKRSVSEMLRQIGGGTYFPVHRLDRPTSGALIFARSKDVARHLGLQFAQRRVKKRYLALVRGWLSEPQTIITDLCHLESKKIQRAQTEIRPLDQLSFPFPSGPYETLRCQLVEAIPHTGRRHQIRRHLKGVSHPIIGDTRYGKGQINRIFREKFGISRLFLHSYGIQFEHPRTMQQLEIIAPIPQEFLKILSKVNFPKDSP